MNKVTELKCTPCYATRQDHIALKLEGKPPKVKQADFIYQGSSMCQKHLVEIVNLVTAAQQAALKQKEKMIQVPGLNPSNFYASSKKRESSSS
jgi:hypothetical protein